MLFEEVWSVEGWCVYCARGWRLCTSVGTTTKRGSGCGVCRLWHAVDKRFHSLPYLKKLWCSGNSDGDDSDGDGSDGSDGNDSEGDDSDGDGSDGDGSDGDGSEGDGSDGDDSDGDGDDSDGDGSEGNGSDSDGSDSDGDEELMATHLLVSLYLYVHKLL